MTTKTTATNPAQEAEQLEAQAAKIAAQAEAARARAEEARRLAEERRQAAITAIRRRRLAQFDPAKLTAEEREAEAVFAKAVLSDNGAAAAFLDWQYASSKRYLLATEAEAARQAVEPNAPAIPTGGPSGLTFADAVQRVLNRELANRTEDLRDELQDELDAAGK